MAKSQSQYQILEASIITSSVGTGRNNTVLDVRANIIEVNFFENIYKPFIDATITLVDDFGLKNLLNIQGTERLRLVIGSSNISDDPPIDKTFFFSKITDTKRTNDRSEILAIELVEEHVYINSIKQFSKSYTGKLEDIIGNISISELGKGIDSHKFSGSIQGTRKIIVPYMSPIEAMTWLKDRATTRTGSPLFLYSSLYRRNLIFSDLDNLLRDDVINEDLPFRYTSAINQMSDNQEASRQYFEIISFKEMDNEDSLALYEQGAIGSFYGSIDGATGRIIGNHISIRDILNEFYANELLPVKSTQSIFDPSLEIDGKLSDEYNSLHIHQVVSTGTYNQFKGYHDETTLIDDKNSLIESRLKAKNKIIRHILKKNVIDIGMSGATFIEGKIDVGKKIRVLFLNSDVQADDKDATKQIDMRKSGDYLIMAMSHKMVSEKHTSILRLTKLGDLPKDFKL